MQVVVVVVDVCGGLSSHALLLFQPLSVMEAGWPLPQPTSIVSPAGCFNHIVCLVSHEDMFPNGLSVSFLLYWITKLFCMLLCFVIVLMLSP